MGTHEINISTDTPTPIVSPTCNTLFHPAPCNTLAPMTSPAPDSRTAHARTPAEDESASPPRFRRLVLQDSRACAGSPRSHPPFGSLADRLPPAGQRRALGEPFTLDCALLRGHVWGAVLDVDGVVRPVIVE